METINTSDSVEKPLRAVIFDIDGTVLDTEGGIYHWLSYVHDLFGDKSKPLEPFSGEFMRHYNAMYEKHGLPGIYNHVVHADWEKNEKGIWDAYNVYNAENRTSTIKRDGVDIADVLQYVYKRGGITKDRSTRLRLGVNTTKNLKSLEPNLKAVDIFDIFDSIVTYDDILHYVADGVIKQDGKVSVSNIDAIRKLVSPEANAHMEKPNSLSSMITMYRLGVHFNEFIVFEDTVNGIKAYKPLLLPEGYKNPYVVGVTWGFERDTQKLIDAGADVIMDSLEDIPRLIESLGGFK